MQDLAPRPPTPHHTWKLPLIYSFVVWILRLYFLPRHEQSSCILSICCFYRLLSSTLLEDSTFPMTTAAYTWALIPAKSGVSVGLQRTHSSKCYNPFNCHTVGKITAPRIKERRPFSFNLWRDIWPEQNDLSPMSHHSLLKTAPSLWKAEIYAWCLTRGYIPAILWCLLSSLLLSLCCNFSCSPKIKPLRQK